MKPLRIDFLPPAQVPVWALVGCTILMAAALATITWAWSAHEQNVDLAQRLAQAQQTQQEANQAAQNTPAQQPPAPPYDADARKALKEAEFATAQALTALEHVSVPGVLPTSVELQAESGLARVEVEFADQPALLKYLGELNAGETPPRWQLLRATTKLPGQAAGLAVLESRW